MSIEKLEERHEKAHDIWASGFDCDTLSFLNDERVADVNKVIFLVGKMNSQVENGGFMQYFDNGYAIGVVGAFQNHEHNYNEHGLFAHDYLLGELKNITNSLPDSLPATIKVIELMEEFKSAIEFDDEQVTFETCPECGGIGEIDEGDLLEGEEDIQPCPECDGDGDIEIMNDNYGHISEDTVNRWSALDSEYYEINDQFLQEIQQHYIDDFDDFDESVRQRVKTMNDIGRRIDNMPEPYKSFVERHFCQVDLCITCVEEETIAFLLENSNTAEDMIEGAKHVYLADDVPEKELRMIFHAYLLGIKRGAEYMVKS